MDDDAQLTPRRTTRNRSKPKKYGEFLDTTPVKRKTQYCSESSDEDFDEDVTPKPKALFGNDDVDGQDIFKFKARHTKNDLQNIVNAALNNSKSSSNKTPRKSQNSLQKNVMKKKIIQAVKSDSSDSDFSGSSSDYVPEKSDDENESSASDSGSDDNNETTSPKKTATIVTSRNKSGNKMKQKDSEYFVTPDNYFMMNSSKKITTSDHTLARLKNMNLDETKETEIHITKEHQIKTTELVHSYDQMFHKWLYILSENFNIVLYGIGSKRIVLERFQHELKDSPCVVINGFFPSLTIKNVLETILIDLLENTHVPTNTGDAVNLIDTQLGECGVDLYVIVHNMDGVMLRNAKSQSMFASLSQLKHVHLIATIDHINAPLLWDHSKLSKFNFTWWDVTTFCPYVAETSYENSLMTQRSGALQLSSLKSVHQSLTTNARGIFRIIVEYQLENSKQSHYQGLPFKELYSKAREQFLVSSDLALRAQLTEFMDHKLVKLKRTYDTGENLVIPIESALLQQFLDQQSTVQ